MVNEWFARYPPEYFGSLSIVFCCVPNEEDENEEDENEGDENEGDENEEGGSVFFKPSLSFILLLIFGASYKGITLLEETLSSEKLDGEEYDGEEYDGEEYDGEEYDGEEYDGDD